LVGRSGSGKSTVTQLLARFYDVRSGTIRVAGHDVRDVTLDSLRAAIGIMPETSFLYADTVHANIAYGRPDATPADVTNAAQAAEADRFIQALPDAYETSLGEQGFTLSGGQRQRIALARTLLAGPGALILDDVTSALDPLVEAEILTTLAQRLADRTC